MLKGRAQLGRLPKLLFDKFVHRPSRKERAKINKEQIISDGRAMEKLLDSGDFQRFLELLREGEIPLLEKTLNDGYPQGEKEKLIARINQIEDAIKLPTQLIWRMKNLPEFIKAKKEEQTRERQALGNKTGGVS